MENLTIRTTMNRRAFRIIDSGSIQIGGANTEEVARLFSAAPDLLEALRRILTHMEPVALDYYKRHEKKPSWESEAAVDLFSGLLTDAKAAIAKAEGKAA